MKDPPRLVDTGDKFTRELLRSGRDDDKMFVRGLAKTAVALGLPATVSSAAAASSLTGGTAASATGLTALAKWLAIGVVAAGATIGTIEYASMAPLETSPPQKAQPALAPSASIEEPRAIAPQVDASDSPGEPEPSPPHDQRPAASSGRSRVAFAPPNPNGHRTKSVAEAKSADSLAADPTSAASSEVSASRLAEEVAALDNARDALQRGDPASALRLVDAYDSPSRTGVLDPEALRVRIESLQRLGKSDEAAQWAAVFVARFPDSPHAARMREILILRASSSQP